MVNYECTTYCHDIMAHYVHNFHSAVGIYLIFSNNNVCIGNLEREIIYGVGVYLTLIQ